VSESICCICGTADYEERRVEYVYRRQGKYLVVRNVPCEVCLRCGERYYSGEILLDIERRFKAIHEGCVEPQSAIQVPVEEYA